MKRIERDELYLEMAHLMSKRSTCGRLQVGCIITYNNRIISSGYNGPLPHESQCQGVCNVSLACERAVHAEANAIYAAARAGVSLQGATIYCTHSPCMKCAEAIVQAGIAYVKYVHDYRDQRCLDRLKSAGIEVEKYEGTLSYTEDI